MQGEKPRRNDRARRGYVFLASAGRRYQELAVNAALSARWRDPQTPVCLIHGGEPMPDHVGEAFDDLVAMPPVEGYVGVMNKMRIYEFAPYEENFFIDADCFILKSDMDRHWEKFAAADFAFAGEAAREGSWYGRPISAMRAATGAPYIVRGNTGVIFFRKGAAAQAVFDRARDFLRSATDVLGAIHQGRKGQYSDEPFFGAAMGAAGLAPIEYRPEEGSIMVTTLHARGCDADIEAERSVVKKPRWSLPTNRIWSPSYVDHSPTIMHFIGLKPKKLFDALTRQAREKFGVPYYDFFAAA